MSRERGFESYAAILHPTNKPGTLGSRVIPATLLTLNRSSLSLSCILACVPAKLIIFVSLSHSDTLAERA